MSYFVGICEWCGKEIYTDIKPKLKPRPETMDELLERISGSNPHYMCAECVRKHIKESED